MMPYAPMPAPRTQEPDADDAGKLSHAEVHYRLGQGGKRCSGCKFFEEPSSCELVQPPIYPAGVCDKFQSAGASLGPGAPAGLATAAPVSAGALLPPAPMQPASPQPSNTMAHGRAIAGAHALHAVGHISAADRDKHVSASRAAIKKAPFERKPFGSFSP